MQTFKKILRGIGLTALTAIVLMVIVYIIMLIDTNSVFNYAKDVFLGKVPHEEVAGTPLSMYDITKREYITKVDLEISRTFTFHNFTDGYMYVRYDHTGYDDSGELRYGSVAEFPRWAIWKIHKENGEWKIVKIREPQGSETIFNIEY